MDLDRWRRIDNLLQLALEHPSGERDDFLRAACAGDEALESEIRSLLSARKEAGSFMESPAMDIAAQELAIQAMEGAENKREPGETTGRPLPADIGGYRIVRLLGEGGMGVVYEAVQEHPHRTVALKVVKPGLNSSLLYRFEHESQALARLQHAGIAQIFEAGVADAGFGPQPYFAMELIRGRSLRDYIEAHHLSVRERLLLMVKICQAVEHAHRRGLIHRDLKPSNILVDETGQPKILDFGVARVIDSEAQVTHQTDIGQLVGTLEYMSPEQVLADPHEIDTRSDVYALGVILYEMLAGRRPYKLSRQLHEAVQTIRDEDPASLSSVSRNYRGDIATIAAKALEKDKSRRYGSAAALAADIERYLNDEPITARPTSTTYQLRKFARRHKALVSGIAAVCLVLVAGIVASTWEAVRAGRAQQAAQSQAAIAQAVNDFLQNDLLSQASAANQSDPNNRPDPDLKVRTALDRAASRIESKFNSQPLVEASIRHTIAGAYNDLDLIPQSQQQLERVLQLQRGALGEDNPDTLDTMNDLAVLYERQGKYADADALETRAVQTGKRLYGTKNPQMLVQTVNLGVLYIDEGKFAQAEQLLTEVLKFQPSIIGKEHPDTLFTMSSLAVLYRNEGKYAQAESLARKVLQARTRILGEEHPDTLTSVSNLAQVYQCQGKYAEAEPLFFKVLEVRRRVLGEGHFSTLVSMNYLADLYRIEGKDSQAEALYTTVLERRRRVLGPEHPDTAEVLDSFGQMRLEERKYFQAETLLREALSAREKRSPDSWQRFNSESMLGAALAGQKKYRAAEPLLISGYEGLLRREASVPQNARSAVEQAGERIVEFYRASGSTEKAAEWKSEIHQEHANTR